MLYFKCLNMVLLNFPEKERRSAYLLGFKDAHMDFDEQHLM